MKLFNEDKKCVDPLAQLFTHLAINSDQSLQEVVNETQKRWLLPNRKSNKENKTPLTPELLALFSQLAMVSACYPSAHQYDYILLLGSDLPDMQMRLSFLENLLKKDVSVSRIVVLCSNRPLYEYEIPYTQAHTEREMIETLLAKMPQYNWPAIEFCESYGKMDADGVRHRATTEDTIKTWLGTQPGPGTCLVISQQPYIGRQNAVLKMYLHNGWKFETVGPKLDANFTLEDMLDTLARWMYQEYQLLNREQF